MGAKSSKKGPAASTNGEQVNQTEEIKATDSVPQSAFVIGDDEDGDGSPKNGQQAAQDGAAGTSSSDKQQQRPILVESVRRETILINEKNKSKIAKFASDGDLYQAFEAGIPLQLLEYREFEGRIKKLVYKKSTVTIRQLQYVLGRDYDDFVELCDAESEISKIIASKAFQHPSAQVDDEEKKEKEQLDVQVEINQLLLFGLLYCKGSHEEKCMRFWDVLQQPGLDMISWEDKELTVAGTWFLEVATYWIHSWSLAQKPEGASQVKEVFGDLAKIKEVSDEIYQGFLDDCFGNQSRVPKEKFIQDIQESCKYLFDPEQLRQKMLAQLEIANQ